MLRIAICDDDNTFTGSLETAVRTEVRNMGLRAETEVFSDGSALLEDMEKGNCYDLIFIDIEMEHINGITAARHIRKIDRSVLLIYVSGYDQYLKELFEVEPFRFLSKPLNMDRFRRYFQEACLRIDDTTAYYRFTFNKEIRKVPLKDVAYFESRNRIIHIFLSDSTEEQFYGRLNEVEQNLMASRLHFLRIHQSFLVNFDYISKMNFTDVTISLAGADKLLKISEDRQKEVRKQLLEIATGKAVIE